MSEDQATWPKVLPVLTEAQQAAREQYMLLWHQQLPNKYAAVERFNHGFPTKLPVKKGIRTLEVGAGLGAHAEFEDLATQEYHCLEYREEFCEELRKKFPNERVWCGDIQTRQIWDDGFFDRVVAIHVLEHLPNLPAAVDEIDRVMKDDGVFDVVIPCEGGFAHSLGRRVTAERLFRKHFDMDFTPIRKSEHVSTYKEILAVVEKKFRIERRGFFPLMIPIASMNVVAGFRFVKKLKD